MGLLRPGFVPPPEIRALRQCTRQLLHLTQDRARCWQRLEKTPEDALCKLASVISKLAGPVPGRAMIAGERDPQVLADLALTRMRAKKPELVKAFTGMRFEDQHAFADGTTGPDAGLGPDATVLPAAARLDEIPGLGLPGAIALIAEIGLGMSRFPTPDALVSWAGPAPVAGQSGPRKGHGKKGNGNSYARRLCTMAAGSAAGTATFPGERHRRLASRPGSGGRPTPRSAAPSS
jgi:transposase